MASDSEVPIREPIPISLVAHWQFCPRRAWLEAAGEKTDTAQMQIGTSQHRGTDDPKTERAGEFKAIDLAHKGWGVSGRSDTLVEAPDGLIVREYKATPVKRRAEVTDAMRVQLALQAASLREMGHDVAGTEVFFTSHHRTVPVELDDDDYRQAELAVGQTRQVVDSAEAPEPLEDSPKCTRCSHATVCLPDERKLQSVERRIVVSDPDNQIVYLGTPGSRASTRQGQMIVTKGEETLAKIPMEKIQGLQVQGNIDLSSGLIRELLWRNISVVWASGTGRMYGWAQSSYGPNGLQRARQHVASQEGRLGLAREFIASKISNQATQLRRAGVESDVVVRLREVQKLVTGAQRWQDIIGLEGEAASLYFSNWPTLLKPRERERWAWSGRSGRPATDPINALLNYVYGALTSDAVRAIISCGLDPHAGFLHSSGRNKPALALDLMEEFRAPVGDSVVQTVINNREVDPNDFDGRLGTWRMNDKARKALMSGYERRMQTEFRHPIFGYSVTWRRALEIQARQVLGFLDGTQSEYRGIRVR
ncbi:CRISPR-associated endonuclease Cas4/Cas1 [Haematomicrobium sanguinis]|uniref:CRISPR-associated endonuclease Cas4/Cas1 n=1 Tax=Haematomicrobium sanguinis TaxID=479106 RepID=UPI0005598A2C|nr:CRISPR-associated endonuclease Cas4/Cas1 [Haematomicrobium sanguinis]